jgi:ATP-dependent Clp protease ATP-binding subunit ClpB
VTLEVTDAALDHLAAVGYDPAFGARPLRRAIQRELQDPLALKLLSGEITDGQTVKVDAADGGLTMTAG